MKKVVVLSLFLVSCFISYSQSEEILPEKRIKSGFNLGGNFSNLIVREGVPSNTNISTGTSFRLGIISEINIVKFISFSPKAELAFNKNNVSILNDDGTTTTFKEMPISLELMAHFNFFKGEGKLKPYLFVGPNLKKSIERRPVTMPTLPNTKTNFAIDFGFGLDTKLTYFNIAPELRYSYGIVDVSRASLLPSLYHHNISLVLNFLG